MELSDLVGLHQLTGVDQGNEPVKSEWDDERFEDSNTITFELDGVIYQAIEDPDDGYRSSMRELRIITDRDIGNQFPAVQVFGIWRGRSGYEENEVVDFYDTTSAKIVLSVGTANTKDYYPFFVAVWAPENLAVNAGK